MDEREGEHQMQTRQHQRQEEYHQHLTVDAAEDILAGHANLLHNGEPALILISLRHLLVTEGFGISCRQKASKTKRSFSPFLEPNERKKPLDLPSHYGRIDSSHSL